MRWRRSCVRATTSRRTGKRPDGWLSPVLAWTEHTADFLAQEKVVWQGDANFTDLPRG